MIRQVFLAVSAVLKISAFFASANAQDYKGVWAMKKSVWLFLTPAERLHVHNFAEYYKDYLTTASTAQSSTRVLLRLARAAAIALEGAYLGELFPFVPNLGKRNTKKSPMSWKYPRLKEKLG